MCWMTGWVRGVISARSAQIFSLWLTGKWTRVQRCFEQRKKTNISLHTSLPTYPDHKCLSICLFPSLWHSPFHGILSPFSIHNKNHLGLSLQSSGDIPPDCDICTPKELNISFSLSPDSAPVGWSLITMEWAANGVCTAPQPPDPGAPPNGSPWRPVTEWQGAFLLGREWGTMIGGRAWPPCFLCHWLDAVLINEQFLRHLTIALIYLQVQRG